MHDCSITLCLVGQTFRRMPRVGLRPRISIVRWQWLLYGSDVRSRWNGRSRAIWRSAYTLAAVAHCGAGCGTVGSRGNGRLRLSLSFVPEVAIPVGSDVVSVCVLGLSLWLKLMVCSRGDKLVKDMIPRVSCLVILMGDGVGLFATTWTSVLLFVRRPPFMIRSWIG